MQTWKEIEGASVAEIVGWAESQSWACKMARCEQDSGWHAEGDVWNHTKMVCAELERLEEWRSLDRQAQMKLVFTALLHDSGKPRTTAIDPETGRTRSPKHAVVGAEIARGVLRDLGCGLEMREEIVALVRYHGRPPYLLEKEKPEHEVISTSCALSNRLLYLFALADTRGRSTNEMSRPEDNLHLWKLLCEEHRCFESRYAFANDQARFLFFRGELSSLFYTPHEDYRCTVTMMAGLPGAGKDTWLSIHRPGTPVVSLDAVRSELEIDATENQGEVIQEAREQCREHLRARRDFAFNATNTTQLTRRRWIDLFADYGARVEVVYIEPPLATISEQNRQRVEPVPTTVINRLTEKLEPPSIKEAHGLKLLDTALE
jgi:putative nucleotidyltransferase with HDIG domain